MRGLCKVTDQSKQAVITDAFLVFGELYLWVKVLSGALVILLIRLYLFTSVTANQLCHEAKGVKQ